MKPSTLTGKHLVLAIARANGWFDASRNAAQATNNPGALTHAPGRFIQVRQRTRADGLVQFQSASDGFAALENVLRSDVGHGETVAGLVAEYAPLRSAAEVAGWLGIGPHVPLRRLTGEWPLVATGWKNCPLAGRPIEWPLRAGYLETIGCERDEPEPAEPPVRRRKDRFFWGLATVAML